MPRVSLVQKEQAHPVVKKLYEKNEAQGWPVLNLFKVLGHCPYIGLNFQRLGNAILHGEGLSPKLRELAILRVGDLAHSVYEFTKHTEIGKKAGVTTQQVAEISKYRTSPAFDEKERAVLAYTDEVAEKIAVQDTTFATLKRYFNEAEIVELTTAIGYYGLVCRVLVALQVELES
ncbi:MAG: carboxymuconolactone decarboxylase family protein [Dehalococcoidales bacterium]|nr:carboxymuconolactone decarboxylase family protein [Dehalococcoidales bacterium]